jgi:hypothetical protein
LCLRRLARWYLVNVVFVQPGSQNKMIKYRKYLLFGFWKRKWAKG